MKCSPLRQRCAAGAMLQTKEERDAAAEEARKEREAAEAKAKAKEDKEKAMREFADTMAKVRQAP